MKKRLNIDIETYSSVDLKKCGVYKYVASPDFEILLFSYSFDGSPVYTVDLTAGEQIPTYILQALTDAAILKIAANATFERLSLSRHIGQHLTADQWECTLVRASMLGLPIALDPLAKVLKVVDQKSASGKGLIKLFCVPCKPTKVNGGRTRNLPEHFPDKWAEFKAYNAQDVRTEMAVGAKLVAYPIPEKEVLLYQLDQRINDAGIMVDVHFVQRAIEIDAQQKELLTAEAALLTGLDNPNSVAQLKDWLSEELDEEVKSLNKESLPELIKGCTDDVILRVLELRLELSKTSIRKYKAMTAAVLGNGRLCGLLQFYGANRTGRWAGRLVQPHNLATNKMPHGSLDAARQIVAGQADGFTGLSLGFASVSDTLSQLIRTAFVAAPGHRFIPADFSAIEARVIAWLAGESWRMDVFALKKSDIYAASAAQMFRVPMESIVYWNGAGKKVEGPNYSLRKRGKVAELALGYQGSTGALIKMGALKEGLQEHELKPLVTAWRTANPKIVKLWYEINDCAIDAVREPGRTFTHRCGCAFKVENGILFITLPSGRKLAYVSPRLVPGQYGDMLVYNGVDQEKKRWTTIDTYGGKLVENITQAIARDALAEAMLRLDAAGYRIVMHVHDEIIVEAPFGVGSCEDINRIMGEPIPWAAGLPLRAESFESPYYKKDG
jgi:DNA polymerase